MPHLPEAKTDALRALPGAAEVIDAVAGETGVFLVGGAVRDLLLGYPHLDFDLVVEGSAAETAARIAATLGCTVVTHERFGTAAVRRDDGLVIDLAGARSETYPRPGALPEVAPADLEHDLARRDFTVNAIAMGLSRDRFGELIEYPGASKDLAARVLRVTHERSFIDDPTRLLRLLRYGARLGFTAEPHTEDLARAAVRSGAPGAVTGGRIADELIDLLAERAAVVALDSMHALGLDRAIHPKFHADEYLASRATLRLAEGLRQDLLLLAACSREMGADELAAWLEELEMTHAERRVVTDAVQHHGTLFSGLAADAPESEFDAALRRRRAETVALAAAMPGVDRALAERARAWLAARHEQRLAISGADLRDAGIGEGPAIGRALAATLSSTLDGEIAGREEQLAYALRVARGGVA